MAWATPPAEAAPSDAPTRRGWATSEFVFAIVGLGLGAALLAWTEHEDTAKWLMMGSIGIYTASRTVVKAAVAMNKDET